MHSWKSILLSCALSCASSLQAQKGPTKNLDSIANWLSTYQESEYNNLLLIIDSLRLDSSALSSRYYQHQLGNFYYLSAQFDSAYTAYQRAAKIASAEGDQGSLNALKNNISVSLIELGRIPEAASLMTELLKIRKGEKDTARYLSTLGNLIEAYQILDNDEKVNQLLEESTALALDSQRFASPLKRIHNLAYFQSYKEENYATALLHLKGLERCNSISYSEKTEGELRLGLGRVYNRQKNFNAAREQLEQASEIFRASNYLGGLTAASFELAELAMETQRPQEALNFYRRALNLAIAPDMKMTALKGLVNAYQSAGEFEKAFLSLLQVQTIKDSLQSLEVQKAVLEIESKYQLRDKESTIVQLSNEAKIAELEAKRLNLYIWSGGAFALLIIAALIFFYQNLKLKRQQESLKQELDKQALNNEKQELQIQLFRSQINPHFFFNTLYAIQSYVLNNEPVQSSRYLGKFARLMRSVLELNENAFIKLEKELALLHDYLELEKLRFEEKFDYQLQCSEELKSLSIPTMILQPFVENAIVHGFTEISTGGQICLSVKQENDFLVIEIEDNGKGFKENKSPQKPGKRSMALSLIRQRLQLLAQADGVNYRFEIFKLRETANRAGTLVRLHLPLNNA